MNSNPDLIILFTKYPRPGEVKTRLIDALGVDGATSLHSEMTKYVFVWLEEASKVLNLELEVWFDGAEEYEMKQFLGDEVAYKLQCGVNLGERMLRAFETSFAEDKERVIIVGSDCPTIRVDTIRQAFEKLDESDVVLGPALDGGYYLVGMSNKCHDIFSHIPWSTAKVLEMTKLRIEEKGLTLGMLEEMSDVDTAEDLHIFEKAKKIAP